jgi:hypothetical protein
VTGRTAGKRIQRVAQLRWVPLAKMRVNPLAQRDLRTYWVDDLLREFDPEQLGSPTVNHLFDDLGDEWFDIIDGQHRIAALRRWFGEGNWEDQSIQCWTYEGLTLAEENDTFLRLNATLPVSSLAKYHAAVRAGRPDESAVDKIVRAEGLRVTNNRLGTGTITAVGTLLRVYRRDPDSLGRALRIIRDSYGDAGLSAAVIDGIGQLCYRYAQELDDQLVVRRLSEAHGKVSGLLTKAAILQKTTGNQLGTCVAASAVDIINSGRGGGRLSGWFRTPPPTRA